jgi:hypothetical protein
MTTDHQQLFYAFKEELKAACRNPKGGFRSSVSVKTLLELECKYAEAETAMMDAQHKRVIGTK